jgi:SAM-dependent methyltransferase
MAWYKKTFGKEYLRIYDSRDEHAALREVDFVLAVLQPPTDAWILDVGCGAGRHAFALAARGYRNVVGLDLSEELLEVALAKAKREDSPALFVRGDMRHLPFRGRFDLALSMFTSFGYFEKDEQNALVLKSMAGALKPKGLFVMDLLNVHHVSANLVEESVGDHEHGRLIQRRKLRKESRRVEKQIIIESGKDGGVTHEFFESVRLYSLEEISAMLEDAGLRVERCDGDFDGGGLTESSPRMIIFGRKANEN